MEEAACSARGAWRNTRHDHMTKTFEHLACVHDDKTGDDSTHVASKQTLRAHQQSYPESEAYRVHSMTTCRNQEHSKNSKRVGSKMVLHSTLSIRRAAQNSSCLYPRTLGDDGNKTIDHARRR